MEFVSCSVLTPERKGRIRNFIAFCNESDRMYYEIYLGSEYSFYPDMNIFYLAEDHSGIVGFLMVYADEADGAEISACVHPARRRQGIFSALFQFACRELERFHYSTILLKTEKAFAGQREFLSHFPAVYRHSEFLMIWDPGNRQPCTAVSGFSLRPAEKEDLPALTAIHAAAFDNPPDVAETYIRETYEGKDSSLYAAFLGGTPVGCVSVDQSGTYQYLFGLCIDPGHRHQGLGRSMLSRLLELLSADSSREIALGVDRENMAALPLYESCGFSRRSETQYFEMKLR